MYRMAPRDAANRWEEQRIGRITYDAPDALSGDWCLSALHQRLQNLSPVHQRAASVRQAVADNKDRMSKLVGDVLSEVIGGPGPISEGARMSAAAGLGGGGAPVQPGELEVNMSVQVTFAIK